MEGKKQRKIGIRITEVSGWEEDSSEVDYLFSSMPRSEAHEALATENADKIETGKWEYEHLPCDCVVKVDMDECDGIDLADDLAVNDILETYHDEINEAAEDFVRDNLCRGDVLLPVEVEWYVTSCDGVKFDEEEEA